MLLMLLRRLLLSLLLRHRLLLSVLRLLERFERPVMLGLRLLGLELDQKEEEDGE
jgi:hypothetical protein